MATPAWQPQQQEMPAQQCQQHQRPLSSGEGLTAHSTTKWDIWEWSYGEAWSKRDLEAEHVLLCMHACVYVCMYVCMCVCVCISICLYLKSLVQIISTKQFPGELHQHLMRVIPLQWPSYLWLDPPLKGSTTSQHCLAEDQASIPPKWDV